MNLRRITGQILDLHASEAALAHACVELHELLSTVSGSRAQASDEALHLPSGVALGTASAAQCLLDTKRTVAFLRGAWRAMQEARERFPAPVDVVYAGTGPYAPLVLPLLPMLDRDCTFTFIDVNPGAVECVQALVQSFAFEPVARVVLADATSYRHERPIHVIVTETMQRALEHEPFVEIVRNLAPQLARGGLLVPERVTIEAIVIDAHAERARWSDPSLARSHVNLGTIFELGAAEENPGIGGDGCSAPVRVTVPHGAGERWLGLATTIHVYDDIGLRDHESGLTMPLVLWPLSPARGGEVVEAHYRLGPKPGVIARRVSA